MRYLDDTNFQTYIMLNHLVHLQTLALICYIIHLKNLPKRSMSIIIIK